MHSVSQTEATKGNDMAQPVKDQHTPGMWSWRSVEGGWDGVVDESGRVLMRLDLNNPANAQLAAAAPEMLSALKKIVEAADSPSQGERLAYFEIHRVFIRAARLAIAKATNV